jgi:hypothetical protein
MAPATDAEPRRVASGCTSDHSVKMTPQQQAEFESRHYATGQVILTEPPAVHFDDLGDDGLNLLTPCHISYGRRTHLVLI